MNTPGDNVFGGKDTWHKAVEDRLGKLEAGSQDLQIELRCANRIVDKLLNMVADSNAKAMFAEALAREAREVGYRPLPLPQGPDPVQGNVDELPEEIKDALEGYMHGPKTESVPQEESERRGPSARLKYYSEMANAAGIPTEKKEPEITT